MDDEEEPVRQYAQVSGAFFCLLATVQLTRAVAGWPVRVADLVIPVWPSVVACLVTGTLAFWAFRSARGAA